MSADGHFLGDTPTREQVLGEIARELMRRREHYPAWIKSGGIKPKIAEARLDRLQAAYDFIQRTWRPGLPLPQLTPIKPP